MVILLRRAAYKIVRLLRRFVYTPLGIFLRYRSRKLDYINFSFPAFSRSVSVFVETLRVDDQLPAYRYSHSSSKPTLYSSAYACMTHSLVQTLDLFSINHKKAWVRYFDSHQDSNSGLFYDPITNSSSFADSDWWGARHLALHMVSAYTALKCRPKYPFSFLTTYYTNAYIDEWIESINWSANEMFDTDVDNKIMNIGCLLQYQRDAWCDQKADHAVELLKSQLRRKLNPETGLWGKTNIKNPNQLSRMIQFAYHLLPLYFYDGDFDFSLEKIANLILATQNKYGGFGVAYNSSACEDIDSVELLIRIYPYLTHNLKARVDESLRKSFRWICLNQVSDGGFVFRLFEPLMYGSDQMKSNINQGALFPTWFRTLSLVYLLDHFCDTNEYRTLSCPGYTYFG